MKLADKAILNILAKSSEAFWLMISSIVMVRYFPKAEYGTFLQIILIADTMQMFTFLGLPQSIYYFFPRALDRGRFVIRNVVLSLCIGFLAAMLVYNFRYVVAGWLSNPLLAEYGWVAALLLFFRAPSALRGPMLISYGSLIFNSVATLLCSTVFFVPLIVASLFSVSLGTLLRVMLISSGVELTIYLCSTLWIAFHTSGKASSPSDSSADASRTEVSFKDQLLYALPIGLSSYLGILGRQIDRYIISIFFSPADFAVYSRGAMKIPVLSTIQMTINNIMTPQYVSAYKEGDIKTFLSIFHRCNEKVVKINFPVFALFWAVAPSLIGFLYTEAYIEAASIFRVYLCLLLIKITSYSITFRASGKTVYGMYATAFYITCNVILSISLVPIFGPIGAAVGTIISEVMLGLFYLTWSCKILGVSFREIFPWMLDFQILSISLLASIPVYGLEYLVHVPGVYVPFMLMAEGLVFCYCWIFLAMRKRLIDQEELELLQRWLRFDVSKMLRKITFLS